MAVLHGWRAARVTPLGELHAPPRMTAVLVRLVVQVVLVASLWSGLGARLLWRWSLNHYTGVNG
ncbi:hypothetical protein [Streptomyces sp. NPDC001401]|uniref:hypothetical protein n=1 Tax=Streptomyces sp. NPDC001401 TaxID=3364570 RepID=UPI0036CE43C9